MDHLDKHKILKDNQHGFRKPRSCETQLIITIQKTAARLAKDNQVDVILLDVGKPLIMFLMKDSYTSWTTMLWVTVQTDGSSLSLAGDGQSIQVLLEGSQLKEAGVLNGDPQGTVTVLCSLLLICLGQLTANKTTSFYNKILMPLMMSIKNISIVRISWAKYNINNITFLELKRRRLYINKQKHFFFFFFLTIRHYLRMCGEKLWSGLRKRPCLKKA